LSIWPPTGQSCMCCKLQALNDPTHVPCKVPAGTNCHCIPLITYLLFLVMATSADFLSCSSCVPLSCFLHVLPGPVFCPFTFPPSHLQIACLKGYLLVLCSCQLEYAASRLRMIFGMCTSTATHNPTQVYKLDKSLANFNGWLLRLCLDTPPHMFKSLLQVLQSFSDPYPVLVSLLCLVLHLQFHLAFPPSPICISLIFMDMSHIASQTCCP